MIHQSNVNITPETLLRIARQLAKLDLPESDLNHMCNTLPNVFNMLDKLQAVDNQPEPDLNVGKHGLRCREDKVSEEDFREKLQSINQHVDAETGYIRVPRVISK